MEDPSMVVADVLESVDTDKFEGNIVYWGDGRLKFVVERLISDDDANARPFVNEASMVMFNDMMNCAVSSRISLMMKCAGTVSYNPSSGGRARAWCFNSHRANAEAEAAEHLADEGASDALDFIADQPKRHRLERSDAVERRAVRALFDDGAAEMHDGAADESDGSDAAAMGGPSDDPRDDGATEQQRPSIAALQDDADHAHYPWESAPSITVDGIVPGALAYYAAALSDAAAAMDVECAPNSERSCSLEAALENGDLQSLTLDVRAALYDGVRLLVGGVQEVHIFEVDLRRFTAVVDLTTQEKASLLCGDNADEVYSRCEVRVWPEQCAAAKTERRWQLRGMSSSRHLNTLRDPRVVGSLAEIIDSGKQRGNHYEPLHCSEQAAILVVLATAELDAGRAGDHLPVRYPRPAATARLEHDAATLLVGIEREPAMAIEKIVADLKELGVLAKTWATAYVTETHAKSLKRAQEARDAYAPAAVRAAVDRVAPQLDAVFKGVVDAACSGLYLNDAPLEQLDVTAQVVALCATIELFEYTTGKAPTITALVSQQSPLLGDWAGGGEHRWTHEARTHLILSLIGLRACRILRFASLALDNPAAPPAPRTFNHPSAPLAVNPDALAEYVQSARRIQINFPTAILHLRRGR
ncbi:hypothetical protein M885DRAFT_623126 [Pelagophyceae sp. CCMP2097]|nr:hypothetical protein M885DRAFT_623126 [Pelagophyceae sp. CCMP2097]